jgi:aminomethyltransferase
MVPFGGWEMPLSYPGGTIEEHLGCRTSAVVFDVSHLGTVRVGGPDAFAALQATFTNDLQKVTVGRAQYTHLLDHDASVLDDIIVWWTAPDRFDVMPNASNTDRVVQALSRGDAPDTEIADVTETRVVLAVQGPQARERLSAVSPHAAEVGRFAVEEVDIDGYLCTVAGTGYTGEDGVECAAPLEAAPSLWAAILDAGIRPAGLGARDTLRLEAGLPLHGHELGAGITPLNAGLGWVVAWDKGDFPGRAALEAQRAAGVSPVLRGLRVEGRRPPRAEQAVLREGVEVGRVTSGNFSPVLGCGIALALLEAGLETGEELVIDARGTELAATVVELPFVRSR